MARKARKQMTDAERKAKGKELAEKHGSTALMAIGRLGKVGSKYEFTEAQIDTLRGAFKSALEKCFGAFEGKKTEEAGLKL